jgi:hypothetical protein
MQAPQSPKIDLVDDLEVINDYYYANQWGDGLPIIPPTQNRIDKMLGSLLQQKNQVIANLPPGYGDATIELIAVNAVLAGCNPSDLPILIAATEAITDPKFNLSAIQPSTNPVAIWVVVSGAIVNENRFNMGINCLGEGNRANATIGRAMRLILRNLGGALPGEMDRSTHGQPGRYTFCCMENMQQTPWESFHQARGFNAAQTSVTVVAIEGTMNMNSHSKDPDELLQIFAKTMIHPPSNEYTHGGEPWLIIGPEHAEILVSTGYGKLQIQEKLWHLSKMPGTEMAKRDFIRAQQSRRSELGELMPHSLLPISKKPEEIQLLVCGGPGTHTVYLPSFGNSRAVSRPVVY